MMDTKCLALGFNRMLSKAISAMALMTYLAGTAVFADEFAVTYVSLDGRYIELSDSWFPAKTDIPGAMMAVEADEIPNADNYKLLNNSNVIVRPWQHDGEWIIIHLLDQGRTIRVHTSEIKTILVDRPWMRAPKHPSVLSPA